MPCLFGRDIGEFERFASVWYGDKQVVPFSQVTKPVLSRPTFLTGLGASYTNNLSDRLSAHLKRSPGAKNRQVCDGLGGFV